MAKQNSPAKRRARAERARFAGEAARITINFDGDLLPCDCPRHTFVGVDCLPVERRDGAVRCLHCGRWFEVDQ